MCNAWDMAHGGMLATLLDMYVALSPFLYSYF